MNPLVSVIIPTHNRSSELERAIRSVLQQTEHSFEILVADDASTEDLSLVVQKVNDARVKLVRKNEKSNANVLRNMGIKESRGEFIAFLDSDDEWKPEHLKLKLEWIKANHCDGVYGSSIVDDGSSQHTIISQQVKTKQHAAEFLLSGGSAPIPSWMIKTDAAREILFDETLLRHQDYEFFVRFAEKYKWTASPHPTLVIHWKKGEKRTRHAGSEINFVSRYYQQLSPQTWRRYHLSHFSEYNEAGGDKNILDYYRREAKRHAGYLSFVDYCTLYPGRKGGLSFFINWIGFCFLILGQKIKKPGIPRLP